MNSAKIIRCLFSCLIFNVICILNCFGEVDISGCTHKDSLKTTYGTGTKSVADKIYPKTTVISIFKSDSIFSFRSAKGYVPSLIHNLGEQAVAPLHFTKKDWLYTGASVAITAALICVDDDIDHWARVQKQKHYWVNRSSPFISEFGSNYGVYSVIAGGLISTALKNEKGIQTSLLATQAMITSGIWAQLIKQLTGRERPKASYIFSGIEGGKWHGVFPMFLEKTPDNSQKFSYDAFPSGHTATAFSIATVYALEYKDKPAIPFLCYTAATAVGISRLTESEHWASDVFVGALLGYLSGKQVVQHFHKTHPGSSISKKPLSDYKPELTLIQNGDLVGISLKW